MSLLKTRIFVGSTKPKKEITPKTSGKSVIIGNTNISQPWLQTIYPRNDRRIFLQVTTNSRKSQFNNK